MCKKISFVRSRQSRKLVCLACSLNYDGDRDPTVASRNPNDKVSKNNTVSKLNLDKGTMSFEKLMKGVSKENKRCKGYLNKHMRADTFDEFFTET